VREVVTAVGEVEVAEAVAEAVEYLGEGREGGREAEGMAVGSAEGLDSVERVVVGQAAARVVVEMVACKHASRSPHNHCRRHIRNLQTQGLRPRTHRCARLHSRRWHCK
jgi:hypothetical protein